MAGDVQCRLHVDLWAGAQVWLVIPGSAAPLQWQLLRFQVPPKSTPVFYLRKNLNGGHEVSLGNFKSNALLNADCT